MLVDWENTKYAVLPLVNAGIASVSTSRAVRMKKAIENGAEIVSLDPRRSELSSIATEWLPIKQLNANIKLQLPFKIQIQATEDDIKNIPNKELTVHYYEDKPPIMITGFVWNTVVVPEQRTIQNYMLLDFMKGNCKKEENKYTRIPFVLDVKGVYIFGENNKKLNLNKIESELVCWYDETPAHIIEAKNYKKVGSNPDATVVSLDVGKEETAEIVITQNNDFSIFHTKKDGQTYKMKTLASYNPKTDEFKIIKENKNEG